MKKNITINLCGRLFQMDEDAYEMISTYEQSLRNYFRSRESGEEIAEDIEARIAELLDEVKAQGAEAINIDHVTDIIQRLGKPEEMDGLSPDPSPADEGKSDENENSTASSFTNGRKGKRLYRDPYDKKVSGVLSGFAAYFGGDVLWWRIGYVGIILLSFLGSTFNFLWWLPGHRFFLNIQFWGFGLIIAYVVLAILMPVAWAPEDRLRMKGKPINPQNIAQQVMDESQRPIVQQRDQSNYAGGCLKALVVVVGITVLFPFILFTIGLLITLIVVAGIKTSMVVGLIGDMPFFPAFSSFVDACQPLFLITLICWLTIVALPTFGIIRLLRGGKKLRSSVTTTLVVVWIFALGLGIACLIGTGIKIAAWEDNEGHEIELIQNRKKLSSIGWTLKTSTNLDEYIVDIRTGFSGLPHYAIQLEMDKYDDITYSAVLEKEVNLPEEGAYQFMSLTEGYDAGLTYTFSYMDGGKEKEAVLRPSEDGLHINTIGCDEVGKYDMLFPHLERETEDSWEQFSQWGEDWVYHWIDLPHVDAGKFKITIKAHECTDRMKIREIKVVKANKGARTVALSNANSIEESVQDSTQESVQDSCEVEGSRVVRIRHGETLASIARRNHTTVRQLCRLNHIRPNSHLRSGQVLRVK